MNRNEYLNGSSRNQIWSEGRKGTLFGEHRGNTLITELRQYCAHPYRVMGEEVPADS